MLAASATSVGSDAGSIRHVQFSLEFIYIQGDLR